jgi:IS30 family transposase
MGYKRNGKPRKSLVNDQVALERLRTLKKMTPRPTLRAIAKAVNYPPSTVFRNIKRMEKQESDVAPST